jgi:hypothetical protein
VFRRPALVACAALLVLASGCGGTPDKPAEKAPTSVAGLDNSRMDLVRVKFCDLVPRTSIADALEEEPTSSRSWGNGDPVPGTASDIAHEQGCAWTGQSGATARSWVFSRPVSVGFARSVVRSSRAAGCREAAAAGFGAPSLVQVCPQPGNARRVRFAGLFAGTWLTCEVTSHAPPVELRRRTSAWCAAVATALDTDD